MQGQASGPTCAAQCRSQRRLCAGEVLVPSPASCPFSAAAPRAYWTGFPVLSREQEGLSHAFLLHRQTNKFNGRKYRSHGRCCFYHPKLLRGSILLPNSGTKPDHLTNTVLGRTFVWDLQQAELPAPTVAVALTSLCREPREAAASWPHACLQAVSLTQRYYGRQPKRGSGRRR